MDNPTLVKTSRLCCQEGGLLKIQRAIGIAVDACRRDVELQCDRVADTDGTDWWDTRAGIFLGDDENDREFRQMLADSVQFLDEVEAVEHHPAHHHWIRFPRAGTTHPADPRPKGQLEAEHIRQGRTL